MNEMLYTLTKVFDVEYVPKNTQRLEIDPRFAGAKDIRVQLHAQITAKIGILFPEQNKPIAFEDFPSQTQAAETKAKEMALDAFNEITQASLRIHRSEFITDKSLQKLCYMKAFNCFKLYDISVDNAYEVPIANFSGIEILHIFNQTPSSCTVKPEDLLSFSLKIGPKKVLAGNFHNQKNQNGDGGRTI